MPPSTRSSNKDKRPGEVIAKFDAQFEDEGEPTKPTSKRTRRSKAATLEQEAKRKAIEAEREAIRAKLKNLERQLQAEASEKGYLHSPDITPNYNCFA